MFMSHEDFLREHDRAVRERAAHARLLELARCCKPSAVKATLTRLRDRFLPAHPACC